ncbi:MAG: DUF1638 domain-containing protein [Anaerolineae bacterium]|nr:DUF1638 domain-containing protein [Anaerolineae bacterium]
MRIKCLSCEALARLVYLCAAHSPHIVDIELFKLGWHKDADDLRQKLQHSIDAVQEDEYDAIILGYGLCGRSTAGLVARNIPLVIPRAHDCITLFLGGRSKYTHEFEDNPGTYWYVRDYLERSVGDTSLSIGADMGADADALYAEYTEKYGKDNADYLMEVMGAWREHYKRAAFIDMGVVDGAASEKEAAEVAERRGWSFDKLAGDLILIKRLLDGDWNEDFLIVQPGETISMSYDWGVMNCILAPVV